MDKTGLTLVPPKKKKSWKKLYIFLIVLVFIAAAAFAVRYVYINYSLEEVEIKGNTSYTDAEIFTAVQAEDYVPNTLVMTIFNKIFRRNYLPFIDKMSMHCKDPHVLNISVKERLRAGVFEYMNKYIYFDEDGMAMESRSQLFEGVPVVTGLQYDKLVLGQKIPVKGDYFSTIVTITKKIATYDLDISEIHFEGEDDITLTSGKFKIYLGSSRNLEEKMAKITPVLESVSKEKKSGTIDLHLYTDEKEIITFFK